MQSLAAANVVVVRTLANTWIQYYDDLQERHYYFNTESETTQWSRPAGENIIPYRRGLSVVAGSSAVKDTMRIKRQGQNRAAALIPRGGAVAMLGL